MCITVDIEALSVQFSAWKICRDTNRIPEYIVVCSVSENVPLHVYPVGHSLAGRTWLTVSLNSNQLGVLKMYQYDDDIIVHTELIIVSRDIQYSTHSFMCKLNFSLKKDPLHILLIIPVVHIYSVLFETVFCKIWQFEIHSVQC